MSFFMNLQFQAEKKAREQKKVLRWHGRQRGMVGVKEKEHFRIALP